VTARLKLVPLFGEGVYAGSRVVTQQRRLNCYLELRKDKEKNSVVCYGTPGLKLAFNAATPLNQPMRGLVGTLSALYLCAGSQVTSVSKTGTVLATAVIGSSSGLVGMALNLTQLMVVDGSSGYVVNPTTGVVTVPGSWFQPGAKTVTNCNGFFVCELPGTNQFYVSALNDGTSGSALAYAAAVQAVDGIIAVDSLGGLLIVFSGGHVEFWQNVGASPEPFQYIQSSATMYGLAAVNGRAHVGNSLFFVCYTAGAGFQNQGGSYQIARIDGYSVRIVSNSDIDRILQDMASSSTVSDATAYSYQVGSHTMVQFNFPTAGRSLLLDASTGFWSEASSGVSSAYAWRHLGNLAAGAFGQTYVADYSNGNLYTLDPYTYTDNGSTIVRELVTRVGLEEYNTFRCSQVYLDMATGVGLTSPGSQGYAPLVELSVSRNNGPFGMPRHFSLGAKGQDTVRVNSRRWGRGRTIALKIRMTDAVPFVLTGGAMRTSVRQGRTGATPSRAAA
jgi:hypothetical protein